MSDTMDAGRGRLAYLSGVDTPTGPILMCASRDGCVGVHYLPNDIRSAVEKEAGPLRVYSRELACAPAIANVGDDVLLATYGRERGARWERYWWLRVHNTRTGKGMSGRLSQKTDVQALSFGTLAGKPVLTVASISDGLILCDPYTLDQVLDLPTPPGAVRALAFGSSHDQPVIYAAGDDGVQAIALR